MISVRRWGSMFSRLEQAIRHLQYHWYSAHVRRHCAVVGDRFVAQGPVVIFGEGDVYLGEHVTIRSRSHQKVEIYTAPNGRLQVGNRTFINQGVRISCSHSITIGEGCIIGDETVILDNDFHASAGGEAAIAPVILEDGVWLATRVIVLRGVIIGQGSVIGAGSVVTRSIPPYTFAAGVPARPLRSLDR